MTRLQLETLAAASERLSWQEWVLQCAEQLTAAHLSACTGALAACGYRSPRHQRAGLCPVRSAPRS